jgi:NADPH-dependent ferric siderophore reductase
MVVAEVSGKEEEQQFASRAAVEVRWLHRNTAAPGATSLLQDALAGLSLPSGEGYAWVAAEAATAKALRQYLVEQRGLDKERVKAAAYWKRGAVAVHETYND